MGERLVYLFVFIFYFTGHHPETSGQELKVGTWGEIEQRPWRNIAYCLAWLAFPYNPGALAQR